MTFLSKSWLDVRARAAKVRAWLQTKVPDQASNAAPDAAKGFAKVRAWLKRMTPDHATAAATVMQALLLLGGAGLGYYQWLQHNALELEQQWNSSDNQIHRNRIMDAYIGFDIHNRSDEQRDIFVQKMSARDLPAMLDFFSDVHYCIHSWLCSSDTACEMFADNARDLNNIFRRPIAIIRLKLANRSWGSAFDDVEQDCASYFKRGADRETTGVITSDNMTDAEKNVQRGMVLEIGDRNSLTYDLLVQACERLAEGNRTKSDSDRTASGCPYEETAATNVADATASTTGQ